MLRSLKIIEVPLNSSLSKEVQNELSNVVDDLKFTKESNSDAADFSALADLTINSDIDLFVWEAEDVPDSLDIKLDFFFIPELSAAIIFKKGSELLQNIRGYFCPPVAFVGGGPGNHEWLTIEAKYILDRCDIVFYDALVNPLIIATLPDDTERYYVGKRGDSKSFDQGELNQLIATYAKRGYKVGRLKGGDPGILGRITEEVDTLLEDRLSFQILPGISAMQAIISSAGIHLTQRGICDRVTLTTARSAGGEINNLLPFKESSLIIYMGILTAEKIQQQLLDAGYDINLPAAILQNLTKDGQRIFHTELGKLAETVNEHKIRPPGLLVLGQTARKDLQRLSPPASLTGRKVLLTSTEQDAIQVSLRIRRWGGTPVFLYRSLMSIDNETVMPEYDDIIFFSPSEVSDFYELLGGPKINPESTIISVGEEVDATFSCLFRKKTIIANEYTEAVDLLKKYLLGLILE